MFYITPSGNFMEEKIKVGFCVSYDWKLLINSIPLIYEYADLICLSLDVNRKGWSGMKYSFDELAFNNFIKSIDLDKKIHLYEDNFFDESITPMENDNRQRRLMGDYMGKGGWHIQIDSDEYFLNFPAFVDYLKKFSSSKLSVSKPINICCPLIPVFKRLERGYLVIDNSESEWEVSPFATMNPEYLSARRNSHFNALSPFFVVHETWSRTREELVQKLESWGHIHDFDKTSYLRFWDAIDGSNYRFVHNFHPIQATVWNKLLYVEAASINELKERLVKDNLFRIRPRSLYLKNSRNWNRVLSVLSKLR